MDRAPSLARRAQQVTLLLLSLIVGASQAFAAEPSAARGEKALLTRSFTHAAWSNQAYDNAWKAWLGYTRKPADYDKEFRERYGLHVPPYPNGKLPMGVRDASGLLLRGVTTDCMLCHGGSIFGKSYVGLGNASLEIQAFFEEMNRADGRPPRTPFRFGTVRGTSEAGAMAVYLLGFREPDLSLRSKRIELGLRDDMCEDPPAWWHLKKKKTMYHTGATDARSVRSLMQFMLSPLNLASTITREESTFADIRAYFLTIQPPKYPLEVDRSLAARGERHFVQTCARCHGTYGPDGVYPNKIVPLETIGTDRTRYDGVSEAFGRYYTQSWFAHEETGWLGDEYPARFTAGYQAPPLDGVWATAPYFHNGSVPTLYDVLKSTTRPKIFTRSFRTERDDYDADKVGWKVRVLERGASSKSSAIERRKVYDTTQIGRGNAGHTFGDALTEEERMAVIEYLKTL